jgi:diphthamide synthase (EF-2-diphthine--ammonia ligase)
LAGAGLEPIFPLWGRPTDRLARDMLDAGLQAIVTCVDPRQIDPSLAGRPYDASFLDALPPSADPCGERGEFHTFCHAGPMFRAPISVAPGEIVERDGFVFADVL